MPTWFAVDDVGRLAVFWAEHTVPGEHGELVDYDEGRDEVLDLSVELSRLLRTEQRPVPGVHAGVTAGELQMLAPMETVQRYATYVEPLAEGLVRAIFKGPHRGIASTFMPEVRTFGAGGPDPVSQLSRLHAEQVCRGCAIDTAYDDLDMRRLCTLGLYGYYCDEQQELLERVIVPETLISEHAIGDLAQRCFRYRGEFGDAEAIPVRALSLRSG